MTWLEKTAVLSALFLLGVSLMVTVASNLHIRANSVDFTALAVAMPLWHLSVTAVIRLFRRHRVR